MTIAAILGGKGHEVVSIAAHHSVAEAVQLLAGRRIGAVPVMDGDAVLGIFSERDVIHSLEREGATALDRRVSEVMTSPAITVSPEESILGALALMTRRRIRHLPVIQDGKCVGVVSIGDLVKHRIDRIESEAEAMRIYIQSA
ncbi:CBS domain-containing protein [Sphingomonas soli]|uniref:CBS domain-containing protein n=1 Tax=Sphingomonas soli TaxID=266127 RepID=UPI000836F7F1|nr:CBS domain-containing protein [Sphingomonas soli]